MYSEQQHYANKCKGVGGASIDRSFRFKVALLQLLRFLFLYCRDGRRGIWVRIALGPPALALFPSTSSGG